MFHQIKESTFTEAYSHIFCRKRKEKQKPNLNYNIPYFKCQVIQLHMFASVRLWVWSWFTSQERYAEVSWLLQDHEERKNKGTEKGRVRMELPAQTEKGITHIHTV